MKYINLILAGFIVLWLSDSANNGAKQKVKNGLVNMFGEPSKSNHVNLDSLPQYRVSADTNKVGRLLVIDERQLQKLNVNMADVTVIKLEQWAGANVGGSDTIKWARADSWESAVAGLGLEKVPVDSGLPEEGE